MLALDRGCAGDTNRVEGVPSHRRGRAEIDCGDAAASWIQAALGRGDYRLVQQHQHDSASSVNQGD